MLARNQDVQSRVNSVLVLLGFIMLMTLSTNAQKDLLPNIQIIDAKTGLTRGYQITDQELVYIGLQSANGQEPYQSAVEQVLDETVKGWNYGIDRIESCGGSDSPGWIDNQEGISRLYSRALAYHLTELQHYAAETKAILERIMSENFQISIDNPQCRLNFSWGIPEIVASADLIESYWIDDTCTGYGGEDFEDDAIISGNCKTVFQNWLARNPYYIISLSAEESQSNWGAAATNTLAYIADYLWDRSDIMLRNRTPPEINDGNEIWLSPQEAYTRANQLALDRMNGYRVDYHSSRACDFMDEEKQLSSVPLVKSQITAEGIIPEDARRDEFCNITNYNGRYQNYPQLHLGHNIQQCELMFRRGDNSCYENISLLDIPEYEFINPSGDIKQTHLYAGRGSIVRAINAIIVDSKTEWRHDSALAVAYRYYFFFHRNDDIALWSEELDRPAKCDQDICFGKLTHGFLESGLSLPPVYIVQEPIAEN
jgi:hypothetical protein